MRVAPLAGCLPSLRVACGHRYATAAGRWLAAERLVGAGAQPGPLGERRAAFEDQRRACRERVRSQEAGMLARCLRGEEVAPSGKDATGA